jgi:predicted dehydrogenase
MSTETSFIGLPIPARISRRRTVGILVNMGIHCLDMLDDWIGAFTPVAYRDDMGGGVKANAGSSCARAAFAELGFFYCGNS